MSVPVHRYSDYAGRLVPSAIRALASVPSPGDTIRFGPGEPDPNLFAVDEFRNAVDAILRDPADARAALQYASSAGNVALRKHICRHIAGRGIADPESMRAAMAMAWEMAQARG